MHQNKKNNSSNKLSILFTVQGEGRGHLSQAIVAYELLKEQGHHITGVIVGGTKAHSLPEYFKKRIHAPVYRIESPGFVRDKQNKAVRLMPTIFSAIGKISRYRKSILVIREIVKRHRPDLILNFYEPLTGVAHLFNCIHTYTLSIAHQYLFLHPSFAFPAVLSGKDRWLLKQYTRLTASGSKQILALSFDEKPFEKKGNILPCPPLLRKEIRSAEPFKGSYLLVYIVNAGYMSTIIEWNKAHPDVVLHCFTDSKKVKDKWEYSDTLTFHSLNDQQFIRYMINAAAVVTTAGFESVCEAFYLNKPVMMVPVEGHAEQTCNAVDGERAGAGIFSPTFNLSKAIALSMEDEKKSDQFKEWVDQLPVILMGTIEEANRKISVGEETPQEMYPDAYSIE